MNINIISVGRVKEGYYTEAVNEYLKRLSPYAVCKIIELPETRLSKSPSEGEINAALEREAELIKKAIPRSSHVTALCIEGEELDSEGFSKRLSRLNVSGVSTFTFLIGGSFGLDKALKSSADLRLSFSRMTLPHSLARVFLLEQLYRALNLQNGGKYHK